MSALAILHQSRIHSGDIGLHVSPVPNCEESGPPALGMMTLIDIDSLPTPPANAQVPSQIQNDTDNWSICSLCAAGTNTTGIQFQLDQDPSGTPLHEWVDKVTLTMW
jgi:hypothetical protein